MPKVVLKTNVAQSPTALWEIIKSFGGLAEWNPLVRKIKTDGDAVGSMREIEFEGAGKFVERLEQMDDRERICTYSVVDSPLPITNCSVRVRITDNGDGTSTMEWSGSFDSTPEAELNAVKTFQRLYQNALDGLESLFAAGTMGPKR